MFRVYTYGISTRNFEFNRNYPTTMFLFVVSLLPTFLQILIKIYNGACAWELDSVQNESMNNPMVLSGVNKFNQIIWHSRTSWFVVT